MYKTIPRNNPCYCINLRRAANALTKCYDQALAHLALTASQFALLVELQAMGPCSKVELANSARLDKSTITRNIKTLKEKNLVADLSERGRRNSQLIVTPLGLDRINESMSHWRQMQAKVREKLGPENIAALYQIAASLDDWVYATEE